MIKPKKAPQDLESASKCEKLLRNVIGPELISVHGKMFASIIYVVMILIASWGCYKLKTDFKVTFLISEESDINKYFIAKDKYFDSGFTVTFYISNPELDFSSIETQQ